MAASQPLKRPGWHWTAYWSRGRAEVMSIDTPTGPRALDTSALWSGFFETFPAGARLLDLATGSGEVARYAQAAGPFDVTGVDYADIPAKAAGEAGPTFIGGVAAEALPFEASTFDGISSQFGIEYADHRPALAELSRVLKPGGRARLVVHHADSVITQQARAQMKAYDAVLGTGAAVRLGRRAFAAQGKSDPAARAASHAAFAQAVTKCRGLIGAGPAFDTVTYMVSYLGDLADRIAAYEPASGLARLDDFEFGNAAWRHRQLCQTRAALDVDGLERFLARAEGVGLSVTARALEHDAYGALLGWRIDLSRSPAG